MTIWNFLRISVVVLAGLAMGCGNKDHDHSGHDHDTPGVEDHSGHDHGDHDKDGSGDAFAELDPADAKLAKAQKMCPVSDEELGSMGTPIKVMVGETPVFICCEGCRKRLLKSPDKYLAKLSK